jgi:hypothetical protein
MAIKHHPELMKNPIHCSPVSADLKLHLIILRPGNNQLTDPQIKPCQNLPLLLKHSRSERPQYPILVSDI